MSRISTLSLSLPRPKAAIQALSTELQETNQVRRGQNETLMSRVEKLESQVKEILAGGDWPDALLGRTQSHASSSETPALGQGSLRY